MFGEVQSEMIFTSMIDTQSNTSYDSASLDLCTFHAQLLGTCASVMTSARSRVNAGNDVSQLLLIVSDGRGIFLEGVEVTFNRITYVRFTRIPVCRRTRMI